MNKLENFKMDLKQLENALAWIETYYKIYGVTAFEDCDFKDCKQIMARFITPPRFNFCRKMVNEECPCHLKRRSFLNNYMNLNTTPAYQELLKRSHGLRKVKNSVIIKGCIKDCYDYYTTFCRYFDEANNEDDMYVNLVIDSEGGSVRTAFYMIEYMRQNRKKKIIGDVYNICHSAATKIFLECDERWMSKNGVFLFHNPVDQNGKSAGCNFIKLFLLLEYREKLKLSLKEIEELCDKAQYHTAQEGLEIGFCHYLF